MLLRGTEAPAQAADLTLAVCEKIAALLNPCLPAGNRVNAVVQIRDWQATAAYANLFLVWGGGERLVAIGCVNICHTLTDGRIARIEEVVVDEAVRDEAMEREILRQITSWVEVGERADAITLNDRVRWLSPRALGQEGFVRPVGAGHWYRPARVLSAEGGR